MSHMDGKLGDTYHPFKICDFPRGKALVFYLSSEGDGSRNQAAWWNVGISKPDRL